MTISLKSRTENHVKIYWDKTQDEEIQKLFPFSINSLEESLKLYQETLKEGASSYGKVIYCDEKYIGDIWCYCIDETNDKMAMLSIVIFEKDLWGKGIATKATKIFTQNVFNKYKLDKIGAFTYSSNYRSRSLLQRSGFSEIETFVEDGIESVYYELGITQS
ncbi:GNAT family N-acetyltransferase [Vallitalea guaymasensis]|uniref:GNAT family N-acetyltransferase n=1 Tax=Vallitalea guaymasensis TaxID=1185412 RepID=UPI000DE1AC91|nr:GNAT family N-acetyltransferase [Vallitalea guaymasensis]